MSAIDKSWSSDVPISMPEPLVDGQPGIIPMYGFTFTIFGLRHDLSASQHEDLSTPAYAPAVDPRKGIHETKP